MALAFIALACSHVLAQVTSPPLPNTPAQPDWSNQRTTAHLPQRPMPHAMEQLRRDGKMIGPAIQTVEARRLLLGTSWLPVMDPVLVNISASGKLAATASQFERLPVELRSGTDWQAVRYDSYATYYPTLRSPIWTIRPAELLINQLSATLPSPPPQDPNQQPAPPSTEPTADKPLRGQRILLVTSESFALARLLAGQGASVSLVIPVPSAIDAALQTDTPYTGSVAGHGMGENVAPDGSLAIFATRMNDADPLSWLADPLMASALQKQVSLEGPYTASLIIQSHAPALPPSRASLLALSASPDVPLLSSQAPSMFYIAAATTQSAQSLRDLASKSPVPLTDDAVIFQKIAEALGWHQANNPVPLTDCIAFYCNLP